MPNEDTKPVQSELLEDRRGTPTLLGRAVDLLEHAQTDRRLAEMRGIASYYDETQKFLDTIRTTKAQGHQLLTLVDRIEDLATREAGVPELRLKGIAQEAGELRSRIMQLPTIPATGDSTDVGRFVDRVVVHINNQIASSQGAHDRHTAAGNLGPAYGRSQVVAELTVLRDEIIKEASKDQAAPSRTAVEG